MQATTKTARAWFLFISILLLRQTVSRQAAPGNPWPAGGERPEAQRIYMSMDGV
jgi:hypothetical protein